MTDIASILSGTAGDPPASTDPVAKTSGFQLGNPAGVSLSDSPDGAAPAQGGTGAILNSSVGAGVGMAQMIAGIIQRKKANSMFPEMVDPLRLEAMQDYRRKASNAAVGAGYNNAMNEVKATQSAGFRALSRTGNIAAAGQFARLSSEEVNNALAAVGQQEGFYDQSADAQLNEIAKQKQLLLEQKYSEMSSRSATNEQQGFSNASAGVSELLSAAGQALPLLATAAI